MANCFACNKPCDVSVCVNPECDFSVIEDDDIFRNRIKELRSLLSRMSEVGDELLPEFEICGTLDNPKNKCPICRETWEIGADEIHTPDCPVTKWAELRKEMEG